VKDECLKADSASCREAMRKADKYAPMRKGTNVHRKWLWCARCQQFVFYDYTPHSLSNPIITGCNGCGRRVLDMEPVAVVKQRVGRSRRQIEKYGDPPHRGEVRRRTA
jgi:hypothetical protein